MALNNTEKKVLNKIAKTVRDGDLYRALHRVGDDPTKSSIEDALRDAITKTQFKKVVAIFKLFTDDDLLADHFDDNGDVVL